ncbi:alpha/beta hydrolase, partial [Chloroflexota bacterium]
QVVEQVEQPILFIHGEEDSVIPAEETVELHAISDNPKDRLWIVPRAEHVNVYRKMPEAYTDRVSRFFQRHII